MFELSPQLSRRLSLRDEKDTIETMKTDNEDTKFTREYCEAIVRKITNDIPEECKEFPNIRAILAKRESNHHDTIAFAGLPPGEIAAAKAARQQGHLNPAQIQRRMTNRGSTRVW